MKYLSVCSGIEAATVAWHPLGWQCVGLSEIEKFPCAVLAHHWPDLRNYGDLTKCEAWDVPEFNVLVGGTPCQGFSVAGKRGGMDDPRSQLAWRFLDIAAKHRPRWVLWENVPGVLSSWSDEEAADTRNPGERWWQTADFDAFLTALRERGYSSAWAVLDAQYRGVAQRRRRVFVVGHLGNWQAAAAVLFDTESLSGNPAPSREKGQGTARDVAHCIRGSGPGTERVGDTRGQDNVVATMKAKGDAHSGFKDEEGLIAHALTGEGHDASEDGTGRGVPLVPDIVPQAMSSKWSKGSSGPAGDEHHNLVPVKAFAQNTRDEVREMDIAGALAAEPGAKQTTYARIGTAVRRLTPRECERLQGFPDDYTLVSWYECCDIRFAEALGKYGCPNCEGDSIARLKTSKDSPRYKALGNSMAVPVMRWLGERIAMVDAML